MSLALISWQSVIAGVIAALAISIIMAVLGVALGFTVVKPKSDSPLSDLGAAFGIWSVFSVVVSLAVGGFVSGLFSGIRGYEHGFMVWATVLLAGMLFGGVAVGGAVRMVGSAVKGVGAGAASIASSVGGGMHHMASSAIDHIKENVDLNFDPSELGDEVVSVIKDTGVETLQPDYIKNEMKEAKNDLKASLRQIRLDFDSYEDAINTFVDKQKARLGKITADVDKDAAVTALMNHRNLPRDEAEKTVDNALNVYNRAVGKAKTALNDAREHFDEAKAHLQQMADQARIKADRFSSAAARSALAAGLALIIGAIICVYAGHYGSRYAFDSEDMFIQAQRSVVVPIERHLDLSLDRP